ncbi:hypothetical protein LOTGIDRAFT_113690 [Lottia gigantea]|uniref:G-protein coupled receptors family 1 profile domain-containing protein n=1 Tax=Lottia gigantea TaxID=225164 RepID=V4A6B9_LOTGI|nr:hypothetical protein LOTGIDRAFT_113690 [Lottia gigantea]ESO99443.1 hypothetical protein LOTGIDRAFT_113690 [Lottia gigantea]
MFLIHIVNIAVADILVGIFVLPILVDFILAGSWKLGDEACQFWVISDILMCTVSIIAIVMVSYDRFIYLNWPKFYSSGYKQYILGSVMVLLPWIIGLGLVLPIWLNGQASQFKSEDSCLLVLQRDFQIASCFISFFVPAFFAICMNFAILIMLCVLRRRWQDRGYIPSSKRPARQVLTVGLVSLVFVVMWTPFFVLVFLKTIDKTFIAPSLLDFAIWFGYLNSGVTPVLWLIYPLVRESYLDLICCIKRTREKPNDETRRTMIDDQPADIELRDM